jgi:MOSC domain-containing protein YiiM
MSGANGKVLSISIIQQEGGEPRTLNEVRVVEGRGLEGDRHWAKAATAPLKPENQVTLIESEAIAALAREYGIEITGAESRRNILTEGVALNHLVNRRFRVGECVFLGRELAEPCGYLEKKTKAGVRQGLIHRGGLRAEIVSGGVVRAGDAVAPC